MNESFLTEAEVEALQSSPLTRKTPFVIQGVSSATETTTKSSR